MDVTWYKDPLEPFHNDADLKQFDAIFQDDGNHMIYPAYRACSGLFFIRNNERTQRFFNAYLSSGDFVLAARNDQTVVQTLIEEHASLYVSK